MRGNARDGLTRLAVGGWWPKGSPPPGLWELGRKRRNATPSKSSLSSMAAPMPNLPFRFAVLIQRPAFMGTPGVSQPARTVVQLGH